MRDPLHYAGFHHAPVPREHGRDEVIGRMFFDMRRASRLTVPALSRRLRIAPELIDSMEAGSIAELPPWAQTVAIVEAYAEVAGVDPSPLLTRLLLHPSINTAPASAAPPPRAESSGAQTVPWPQAEAWPAWPPQLQSPDPGAYGAPLPSYIDETLPLVEQQPTRHMAQAFPQISQLPPQPPKQTVQPGYLADVSPPEAFDPRAIGRPRVLRSAQATASIPAIGTSQSLTESVPSESARRAQLEADLKAAPVAAAMRPASYAQRLAKAVALLVAVVAFVLGAREYGASTITASHAWFPEAARPSLRRISEPVVRLISPRRDGQLWIEVGDPRLRKTGRETR